MVKGGMLKVRITFDNLRYLTIFVETKNKYMNSNELRVGNIVHSTVWYQDVVVDIENINYHDDFEGIRITGEKLVLLGFSKFNDNYTIETVHGLLTDKPSKMTLRYTKAKNWVVTRPANRTIYLSSIHELQNLFHSLTKNELNVSSLVPVEEVETV
jgi:hypothetical protein